MQDLVIELEHHSIAKKALENAMLDFVDLFHQCSGLTARQVYDTIVSATITLPGDTFQLNRHRFYLSSRLNEQFQPEGDLDWWWPLKYQIPLRPSAYRIPPLRRPEKTLVMGVNTQTPISMADAQNTLLAFQNPQYELRWVLKPEQ